MSCFLLCGLLAGLPAYLTPVPGAGLSSPGRAGDWLVVVFGLVASVATINAHFAMVRAMRCANVG